jgi:hypothetical protein
MNDIQEKVENVPTQYPFIEEYLDEPNIITGKPGPIFIKLMSTILFLRQRIGFSVDSTDTFYDCINQNNYSKFENINKVELYPILLYFINIACMYICDNVDDEEDIKKIIPKIQCYATK